MTFDLVEHSTSVRPTNDFCVVSRVPLTVPVRPLRYLTCGNAFYHIFEVGGRRPPASHATLTTGCTYSENLVKICPVHSDIIGLQGDL